MSEKNFIDVFFKEYYFTDFYCFNIGYEKCVSKHRFGPSLKGNYLIHYIVSGKGCYTVNQTTYHLSQGDFFLIKPNEVVTYEADEENPWEYYWIGFSGEKVNELLLANGLSPNDYVGHVSEEDFSEQLQAFLTLDFFDDRLKLTNQAAFYAIFSCFKTSQKNHSKRNPVSRKKKYVESFLLYVENNYYREDLTIEEIAHSMYLNAAYFSQLIKEELALTALEYLNLYRMNQASLLLLTTDLTVEEISHAIGYQNRHSFSRSFKKRFQCTPSEYKKKN